MGGVSQTRNTIIADILYRLKLIESYGTGIQRFLETYEDWKVKPLFTAAPSSFVAVLPNMNEISTLHYNESLSDAENVINLITLKGEISRKDIEQLLNCSQFPAITVLNSLLDDQKIVRIDPARSTKYILS